MKFSQQILTNALKKNDNSQQCQMHLFFVLEKTMVSAVFFLSLCALPFNDVFVLIYVYNTKPLNMNGNGQNFWFIFSIILLFSAFYIPWNLNTLLKFYIMMKWRNKYKTFLFVNCFCCCCCFHLHLFFLLMVQKKYK